MESLSYYKLKSKKLVTINFSSLIRILFSWRLDFKNDFLLNSPGSDIGNVYFLTYL